VDRFDVEGVVVVKLGSRFDVSICHDGISVCGVTIMKPSPRSISPSKRGAGGLILRSAEVIVVLMLSERWFLLPLVFVRGREVCRLLNIGMSCGSFVLPRRAGTSEDLDLYSRNVESGGPPRSSTSTARSTTDMRSAGWYVWAISCRAADRHSRYCILLLRSVGSLRKAKAATRAVAAVPWRHCQYPGIDFEYVNLRHAATP
jgi:hypothetical protein